VAVAHELLHDERLDRLRFSIQAFADAKPLVDNETAENRAKNRRVEIIISQAKSDLGITPDKVGSPEMDEKLKNKTSSKEAGSKQSDKMNNTSKKSTQTNQNNNDDALAPETGNIEDAPSFIQF
jgi:flagellar motor protein MotB